MKMKPTRQLAVNIFLGAVALSAAIAISSLYIGLSPESGNAADPEQTTEQGEPFIMRISDGRLALFRGISETPCRVYDYDITLLTEYDRNALESGMKLATEKEAQRLIDDLTS